MTMRPHMTRGYNGMLGNWRNIHIGDIVDHKNDDACRDGRVMSVDGVMAMVKWPRFDLKSEEYIDNLWKCNS